MTEKFVDLPTIGLEVNYHGEEEIGCRAAAEAGHDLVRKIDESFLVPVDVAGECRRLDGGQGDELGTGRTFHNGQP